MELKQHLVPQLKALRLAGILDTLEVRTQQAIGEQWSYGDFLERLLEDEVERRAQKQLTLRVRRATLDSHKTLETFDFTFNPSLDLELHRTACFIQKQAVLFLMECVELSCAGWESIRCRAVPKSIPGIAHSTINMPRSMPIWHWKPYSPGLTGVNSTATSCPSGNLAL